MRRSQKDYDERLRLHLFEGKGLEKLDEFKLNLPIDNRGDEKTTRIVDLYLHHRTQ